MFSIKELACSMASPSVAALGHLRKLIGFMKQMGDIGVRLFSPNLAKGNSVQEELTIGFLKATVMLTGVPIRQTGVLLRVAWIL